MKTLLFALLIFVSSHTLHAQMSDKDKILILTNYLIEKEDKDVVSARNEAIATIYGEPKFQDLVYDDASEMFFARLVSQRGDFSKDINFYMPRQRAIKFKKELDAGLIKIEHAFDDNEIVIKNVEIEYKDVEYPIRIKESSKISLKLGAYFVVNQNTEILAKQNGVGGIINLQEFLDSETQAQVFRLETLYKFNAKHAVEFSYYKIHNSSQKVVDKSFEYNGEMIDAGALISTTFNTDIYKLNYLYSAYQTNKINLTFRVGLHITKIASTLEGQFQSNEDDQTLQNETVSLTAPLPVFGLGLNYQIIPQLSLNYKMDYFFLSYEDIRGSMTDTSLSLEYKYNHYIGAGVGFNSTKMNIKAKTEGTDFELRHDVSGLLGYLIFTY